ncbi:hypothetical protein [Methylobacterium sp. Leaf99]|uniref:hypothetical protein n=1 Tax=Methylobacterium sp. Leaf99 TaxID=1736251 RepID=UPI0012ED4189|nr:hypothetical protein [Methylobacterium sp. Leaf99]
MAETASGARTLRVDSEPRLLVFGFDADQRGGAIRAVTAELRGRHPLRVCAVRRLGGRTMDAFRRSTDSITDPKPDAA